MSTKNTHYLEIQKKAKASFKKLLKLNEKLTKQGLAFFYLQNTPAASSGSIFKPMTNYNQALPSGPQFPSNISKPKILVVADNIFNMDDDSLMQPARLAVPNCRPITGLNSRISDVKSCDGKANND